MSNEQNTNIPQLDKANGVLMDMAVNITRSDRQAAEQAFSLRRETVGIYVRGEGTSLDTAMSLIEFFRGRIETRERNLTYLRNRA